MNKYPNWWNSTITVYNRYEDPTTNVVTWYRTELTDCFWKVMVDVVYPNDSLSKTYTNVILCRIPVNSNYANPYEYKRLTAQERADRFTLQIGDIIVNGSVEDSIDEYTKGARSTDFVAKYKDLGIIRIESVSDNSDSARNIPHYLASQAV